MVRARSCVWLWLWLRLLLLLWLWPWLWLWLWPWPWPWPWLWLCGWISVSLCVLALELTTFPGCLWACVCGSAVKNQLVKFSSAAPATALVTFYFLRLGLVGASLRMLAVCFMFSGGTFLFVSAAHILPEIQASQDADTTPAHRRTRFANMWVMVCGIILPLLIIIEQGH